MLHAEGQVRKTPSLRRPGFGLYLGALMREWEVGGSGCSDVRGPRFTKGLVRCPLEKREESLDSKSYPWAHKKKESEEKKGRRAQGETCVKKKKMLLHSWDQSFPGLPHLLGKAGILYGAI